MADMHRRQKESADAAQKNKTKICCRDSLWAGERARFVPFSCVGSKAAGVSSICTVQGSQSKELVRGPPELVQHFRL
jgi:hypothetical protein